MSLYIHEPPRVGLVAEAQRAHRERMLRMSMNAVPDAGINLKRKLSLVVPEKLPAPPKKAADPEPTPPQPRPLPVLAKPQAAAIPIVPVRQIQIATVRHFLMQGRNLSFEDILSHHRLKFMTRARQIAIYLARVLTKQTLPWIGLQFGGRDHTTVLYAVRKIGAGIEHDAELAADVAAILDLLRVKGYRVDEILHPQLGDAA